MNIMVIAPHPDDETLGCGGTLLKHIENGDNVYWVIVTGMHEGQYSKEVCLERDDIIEKVHHMYGFRKTIRLEVPTCKVHEYDFNKLIKQLSEAINEVKPETIYTVNRGDVHTDHQVIAKAVWSCTKAFRYPYIKKILMYETVSETEYAPQLPENIFIPNVYSDITPYLDKKLEILKNYKGEIGELPFPRSLENVKALATYRGCSINKNYAEAFMLIKEII